MTSSFDSTSSPAPAAPPTYPRRKRGAGHIVAIVIGCLVLLPGFGMLAGGGAISIGQAVATDDDGYFHFTLDRVESDGVAIATTDLWLDDVEGDASPWMLDWLDLDLRLRVEGARATDDVFVGIARSADVQRYLDDVTYTRVIELDHRAPRYREQLGTNEIGSPLDQDFWAESASGAGEQELVWDTRGGRWSVVVMNADGSPSVAADVEVGARSGAITPIAVTLLVIGGIVTTAAIVLIVIGARGRHSPDSPADDSPADSPLPPPAPESAVRLDEDRSPSPVG
jgi:hypothetical protein